MGKTPLIIISSVILIAILVSVLNVGTSLFLKSPDYSEVCDMSIYNKPHPLEEPTQKELDEITRCNTEYEDLQRDYNQKRFYIFAGIGFLSLLLGLFISVPLVQWTGLGFGLISVVQSVVFNFANKTLVFFTLLGILIIFGIFAWRKTR